MAAPARSSRTYLGGDARRAQILRVAGDLFSERHYDAVSTAEIAAAAGVARGLVHHYFGTKRELFLDVVRSMLAVPDELLPPDDGERRDRDELVRIAVDRWLRTAQRNRGTWLATSGGSGIGRDPDLEAVLRESRERIIDRLIAISWGSPEEAPREARVLMEGYAALAEAVTADWLQRGRLPRRTVHALLVQSLLHLVDGVLPAVAEA